MCGALSRRVNGVQWDTMRSRRTRTVFILGSSPQHGAPPSLDLDPDLAPACRNHPDLAIANPPIQRLAAQAEAAGLPKEQAGQLQFPVGRGKDAQQHSSPALLHADRLPPDVEGTGGKELLRNVGELLAGLIVHVRFQQKDLLTCGIRRHDWYGVCCLLDGASGIGFSDPHPPRVEPPDIPAPEPLPVRSVPE